MKQQSNTAKKFAKINLGFGILLFPVLIVNMEMVLTLPMGMILAGHFMVCFFSACVIWGNEKYMYGVIFSYLVLFGGTVSNMLRY